MWYAVYTCERLGMLVFIPNLWSWKGRKYCFQYLHHQGNDYSPWCLDQHWVIIFSPSVETSLNSLLCKTKLFLLFSLQVVKKSGSFTSISSFPISLFPTSGSPALQSHRELGQHWWRGVWHTTHLCHSNPKCLQSVHQESCLAHSCLISSHWNSVMLQSFLCWVLCVKYHLCAD